MKTSKPFSTISYNSISFLKQVLDRLIYFKKISYYEFIQHLPDTDDKKAHIHLYIEPAKLLEVESIKHEFNEYDFKFLTKNKYVKRSSYNKSLVMSVIRPKRYLNKFKPLGIIHFQSSKFGDWYWYSIHNPDYLKAKMLTRNVFYDDGCIFSSDYETHLYKVAENPLINFANMSDIALRDYIYQCVCEGKSLQFLLNSCRVPLGKINSVIHFYNALAPVYSPTHILPDPNQTKQITKNLVNDRVKSILNGTAQGVQDTFVFNDTDELYD